MSELLSCHILIVFFLFLWTFVSQHAVGYVTGDQYYGAKASINVWAPRVANQYEFSLSQMWVISGSFGDDLNTIEAGWQACSCSSDIDFSPRKESLLELFQFWTWTGEYMRNPPQALPLRQALSFTIVSISWIVGTMSSNYTSW